MSAALMVLGAIGGGMYDAGMSPYYWAQAQSALKTPTFNEKPLFSPEQVDSVKKGSDVQQLIQALRNMNNGLGNWGEGLKSWDVGLRGNTDPGVAAAIGGQPSQPVEPEWTPRLGQENLWEMPLGSMK